MLSFEHRLDPLFRDAFNRALQKPLATLTQFLIRRFNYIPETKLCTEQELPDEARVGAEITGLMATFIRTHYQPGNAQRAGNTKTYGIVHAEFKVLDQMPANTKRGLFASPGLYSSWIRFAGPGPLSPPDIDDAGIMSIGIKVTGVSGPKFLPDEEYTQDFLGISCPTFTTPNVTENLKLQRNIAAGTPVFYFLSPFDSHYLDGIMQGLYARMNSNPLEGSYWSCVPYLLGEGQAMKYSIRPISTGRTKIPVWDIPNNWLAQAMAVTLSNQDWEMEFLVQLQIDACRMPIENAAVEWPESLSPMIPVARIRIPRQTFLTADRRLMDQELSFNPWHCIGEHRPLGNQNRARKLIYQNLSNLRQSMNWTPHIEP